MWLVSKTKSLDRNACFGCEGSTQTPDKIRKWYTITNGALSPNPFDGFDIRCGNDNTDITPTKRPTQGPTPRATPSPTNHDEYVMISPFLLLGHRVNVHITTSVPVFSIQFIVTIKKACKKFGVTSVCPAPAHVTHLKGGLARSVGWHPQFTSNQIFAPSPQDLAGGMVKNLPPTKNAVLLQFSLDPKVQYQTVCLENVQIIAQSKERGQQIVSIPKRCWVRPAPTSAPTPSIKEQQVDMRYVHTCSCMCVMYYEHIAVPRAVFVAPRKTCLW